MNVYLKSFLFLVVFSVLHMGYELTEWRFLTPFCGVNESVFQHLKMAFWGYLFLAGLIEYPFVKRKDSLPVNFWYSRFLTAVMLPWVVFLLWYILPGFCGRFHSLWADLAWAVCITYLSCLFTGYIEKSMEDANFSLSARYSILLLLFVSCLLFVWFTYKLPWIDLFVNPENL
ncbi:hypothetical protein DRQ18_07775, partial [bacterium]